MKLADFELSILVFQTATALQEKKMYIENAVIANVM
jgi:hypothetical protein